MKPGGLSSEPRAMHGSAIVGNTFIIFGGINTNA